MTNFEYFKDDILKMREDKDSILAVQNGRPVHCRSIVCARCDFFRKPASCRIKFIDWLYSEHRV